MAMVMVMVTPDDVPYKHITKITETIHLLSFNYILYWSFKDMWRGWEVGRVRGRVRGECAREHIE